MRVPEPIPPWIPTEDCICNGQHIPKTHEAKPDRLEWEKKEKNRRKLNIVVGDFSIHFQKLLKQTRKNK